MRKLFTFLFAALMSVSMYATTEVTFTKVPATEPDGPYREYLSLDPAAWTWGYNSVSGAGEGGLQTTIVSDWGAVSMGWDPERDLSEWDKIVFEVSHMDGCAGEWFKLKAYLRDASDSEGKQMEGLLGLDAPDNELNYLVIDLHQQVEGFDLTKARILAVQCEPTGGIFTISSVYLLKEDAPAAPQPETAPAVPEAQEMNVMALYSNHYLENNLNFNVLGWGDVVWDTLTLGESSTKVLYTQDMKWEMMTNFDIDCYDMSAYNKFHVDIWVPFAAKAKVTFEAKNGWKQGVSFDLEEGWNAIDADMTEWIAEAQYDWKDVKYIAFEGYQMPDETSAEGNPFAFANAYFYYSADLDAVENVEMNAGAQKVIVDGMIYIVRNGKLFNLQGAQVK